MGVSTVHELPIRGEGKTHDFTSVLSTIQGQVVKAFKMPQNDTHTLRCMKFSTLSQMRIHCSQSSKLFVVVVNAFKYIYMSHYL